jgi:hypothetical protein
MKQAVRVNDDQDDDDGGMDAAAYVVIACGVLAGSLFIAAMLWLPELYRWAHGRGL